MKKAPPQRCCKPVNLLQTTVKLFIWIIVDTVVEHGIAIGFAPTKEEAIEAICEECVDEFRDELRKELLEVEPDIATSQPHGYFSESPT